MTLLNPIWLWGLSTLSIPIAIHLLSRKEGPVVRVGSIRFLSETSTSKFSSIRLNEVALLIVRSLLVFLMVLFLAGMLLPAKISKDPTKWALVEQGLEQNASLKPVLDSLQKSGYALRELSPGFPELRQQTDAIPDYFKLSEDLATRNVRAIVFARNELTRFKGKRTALPANVQWITYPDNIHDNKRMLKNFQPIHVTLAYDPGFVADKKIMTAALEAIALVMPEKISIVETLANNLSSSHTGWLIWLSEKEPLPAGNILRVKETSSSSLIIQESKNQWLLTKRLNEENALDEHLAIELATLFFNQQIQTKLKEVHVTMPNELVWTKDESSEVETAAVAGVSVDKYLLLTIVLFLILERVLAFYRKQ